MHRPHIKYRLLATVVLCTLLGLVYLGVMQAVESLQAADQGGAGPNPASERVGLYIFTLFAVSLIMLLAFFYKLERWYHRSFRRSLSRELYIDPLTETWNRRACERDLAHLFSVWTDSRVNSVIFFLDIDDFKLINDTWGHYTGDLVLQRVLRQLQTVLRRSDKIYRWGGEELIVVCEGMTLHHGQALGQVLVDTVAALRDPSIPEMRVTASVGMTHFFGTDTHYCHALKRADRAMYHAKRSGKNRLACHDALRSSENSLPMNHVV